MMNDMKTGKPCRGDPWQGGGGGGGRLKAAAATSVSCVHQPMGSAQHQPMGSAQHQTLGSALELKLMYVAGRAEACVC